MKGTVSLIEVAEQLDFMPEDHIVFVNRNTGEIVDIDLYYYNLVEEHDESRLKSLQPWELKWVEVIQDVFINEKDYEPLPNRYFIDEYGMMEDFCFTLNDEQKSKCLHTIKGKGAFRRFKDLIYRLNIEQDWYQYKEKCLLDFAAKWCDEVGLTYNTKEK